MGGDKWTRLCGVRLVPIGKKKDYGMLSAGACGGVVTASGRDSGVRLVLIGKKRLRGVERWY